MQRRHRRTHLRLWLGLAVLLPALLAAALLLRPGGAGDAPLRLAPPALAR
jgi:hypothetical protein